MEIMKIQHVSVAGAGNLAWHLASAFTECGITIREITNRTPEKGRELAERVNARFVESPSLLDPSVDMILVAVSDAAIAGTVSSLKNTGNTLIVHASGSVGMDVLKHSSSRTGVFYPVQTFKKGTPLNFRSVPICIESNNPVDEERLLELGRLISDNVTLVDSEHRKILHLAAVIACNFPNFMYTIADDILKTHDLPFSLLSSLITQTAQGAAAGSPFARQTGPAFREDNNVLESHLKLLEQYPGYREIYNLISQSIIQHKEKDAKL